LLAALADPTPALPEDGEGEDAVNRKVAPCALRP
jgi:hypothetical protein